MRNGATNLIQVMHDRVEAPVVNVGHVCRRSRKYWEGKPGLNLGPYKDNTHQLSSILMWATKGLQEMCNISCSSNCLYGCEAPAAHISGSTEDIAGGIPIVSTSSVQSWQGHSFDLVELGWDQEGLWESIFHNWTIHCFIEEDCFCPAGS